MILEEILFTAEQDEKVKWDRKEKLAVLVLVETLVLLVEVDCPDPKVLKVHLEKLVMLDSW